MGEEQETSTVDDLFKDLHVEEPETGEAGEEEPKVETNPDETTVDDLKTQLEEMKSERHGLLQAAKSERHKRQDMKSNLSNLQTTVNNILQQRQAAKKDDPEDIGVPVEFSEDGNEAFISGNKITDLLNPLHNEIAQLKKALNVNSVAAEGQRQAQETIDTLVGSDERYGTVFNKYKTARKWVNDHVLDFQRDNDLTGVMTSGQALDNVLTKDIENDFKEKFPEFSMVDVVTAGDSQRHFTSMLSKTADTFDALFNKDNNQNTNKTGDDKFKKIINKPAGLSDNTNAKANELSITEKVGNLATSDIMDLTDAQAKQLEQALLNEEKSEGVTF